MLMYCRMQTRAINRKRQSPTPSHSMAWTSLWPKYMPPTRPPTNSKWPSRESTNCSKRNRTNTMLPKPSKSRIRQHHYPRRSLKSPRIDDAKLFIESDNYVLTHEEIASFIRKFNTGSDRGYGAILIAGLLNKSKNRATYTVVIFNIDTKEIVSQQQITSKARGFGLRNFWAGSVHATLKQIKNL